MKLPISIALLSLIQFAPAQTSENTPRLQEALERFPKADADGDGVLTIEEATDPEGVSAKPNAMVLFIDDLGYGDTWPFGCKDIPTPNIDRLAWLTDYNGDRMVEFVERNKDVPFFLYFSPDAVHSPSDEAPPSLKSRTTVDPKNAKRRALGGAIVSVDDQVGKLLAVLEKHKLRDNTLVIFTSDNGANGEDGGSSAPYSGGKGQGTQKEGWLRVPSVFSYPGLLPQGRTYAGLTCNLDFYATIAALIQKPAPPDLDGLDMIPYLKGEKTGDAHDFLFWLNNDPDDAKRRHLTAVRWKNWRLYRDMELGWQLFNLKTDPLENRDIAKKHPDVVETMSEQHAAWAATLAPLGKIDAPPPNLPPIIPPGYGWAFAKTNSK